MKTVIIDIETNGLKNPDKIHCIVCKDVHTGEVNVFRTLVDFADYALGIDCFIGHNLLAYDIPILNKFLDHGLRLRDCIDTLILSRLFNYQIVGGHSLEAWGERLSHKKVGLDITDWSEWTQEIEDRCVNDVHLNEKIYKKFLPYIDSNRWKQAIRTEHDIALVCHDIHLAGFHFDIDKARKLYYDVSKEVDILNGELGDAFPRRSKLDREYVPRATKFGTISKSSVPRGTDLTYYTLDAPFSTFQWEEFNPGSPKQVVERLNEAGWKPTEKTKGHLDALRSRDREKLQHFKTYGWSITEANLGTLPPDAPNAARTLCRWLLLSSRKRKFDEWFSAYNENTRRIHGTITSIGTWTHRASHSDPNMGNIPTEKPQDTPEIKELNNEMRRCWISPEGAYLVGVDADGIQLRILAHYMEDQRFVDALVSGHKDNATDIHSLNAVALGRPCKGRRDAKTFIYAWILGAGISKVAEILDCSRSDAVDADSNFLGYYPGLKRIIENVVPFDVRRGYIEGIDGRYVLLSAKRAETNPVGCVIGGYLQNGEKVLMSRSAQIWKPRLEKDGLWKHCRLVNWVHDEFITEVNADREAAEHVATEQAEAIREAGESYNLRCPILGTKQVGRNWLEVH